MGDSADTGATGPGGFHCPRCSSSRVRRSAPHSVGERLLRAFSPLHFYRCRDCGHRGVHMGALERAGAGGRRLESRDIEDMRARRLRAMVLMILAAAVGAIAGLNIYSCG